MQINQFCLIIRRCLDVNEKNVFLFKNCIFYRVFRFVIVKLLLIGTTVDFDGLFAVSLLGDIFSAFIQI